MTVIPRCFRIAGWLLIGLAIGGVPLLVVGWMQGVQALYLGTLIFSMVSAMVTGWSALHGVGA